ncbi:Uncharacterized protein HZ326_29516 [Fusarium oxysporum f. sp. albedinis]|nr:Uncharacterized protein HZ326_29516 [Fusarium oxysporum f. sp. albedinis]
MGGTVEVVSERCISWHLKRALIWKGEVENGVQTYPTPPYYIPDFWLPCIYPRPLIYLRLPYTTPESRPRPIPGPDPSKSSRLPSTSR